MPWYDWAWRIWRWLRRHPPPTPSPTPTPPGTPSVSFALLSACNREREQVHLPPLSLDARLGTAAQAHAEYMASRHRLAHVGADGSWPWDRAARAGYRSGVVSENIAEGQNSPAEVVQDWMGSAGHRANVLSARFRDVGFGTAKSVYGRSYWCALFGGG